MAPASEVSSLFASFSRSVSPGRIEAYRRDGDDDLETLTRYAWNICLCEALYPVLQILEVGFRNSLHDAATNFFGTPRWYKQPNLLQPSAANMVTEAEEEVHSQAKDPADPGRVVAELNFGFWTNLLNKRYEQTLWPRLLKTTFPFLPAPVRTRDFAHKRFERIRRVRNRIFHHEPILKYDLTRLHAEVLDAMDWLNPSMKRMTLIVDHFPAVYTVEHRDNLKALLEYECRPKSPAATQPTAAETAGSNTAATDHAPDSTDKTERP